MKSENEKKNALIDQLSQKCSDLEVRTSKATTASETTTSTPTTTTTTTTSRVLQTELDSLTRQLREKRAELHEREVEMERLRRLVSELEAEKTELSGELAETKVRLDAALERDEMSQQTNGNLQNELYAKQSELDECQRLIDSLSASRGRSEYDEQRLEAERQQRELAEAQLAELKCALDHRESELRRAREMYIEVCADKNNLHDTIKAQLDVEFDARLRDRLEADIVARLDQQKLALDIEFNKQIDQKLGASPLFNLFIF